MARDTLRMKRRAARGGSLQRYLGSDEQTLHITRQHPFALIHEATSVLALIVPLLIAAWGIAGLEPLNGVIGTWLIRSLFLIMLGLVARLAWSVLAWEFERVVITDEKVILLSGVLARRIASTPLAKVSEFTVSQPMLGRVFDYGSLVVDVPGGRDQALHGLAYLPDPAGLYRLVSDQARRGRTREGGGREARHDEAVQAPAPTAEEIGRLQPRPDPWQSIELGKLEGSAADHTIQIPRVPPRQ